MTIIIKKSTEILNEEWINYASSFNKVFDRQIEVDHFKHKYLLTVDQNSYHAFLTKEHKIVGACNIMPYFYSFFDKKIKIGLAVDVFILEEFRYDPLALLKMYKLLKETIKEYNISLVIAVPNDIAYPYWKNVVKWKDIGLLSYYALPIKLGNVIKKTPPYLNYLSQLLFKTTSYISAIIRIHEKPLPIKIDRRSTIVDKQRYNSNHILHEIDNIFFSYRIMEEDGVKTCYLIDFYNKKTLLKDSKCLRLTLKYLLKNNSIDIIIFVGKLTFPQLSLFKVPFKFEPKHLNLTVDFLEPFDQEFIDYVLAIKNWDFGLYNYDVR